MLHRPAVCAMGATPSHQMFVKVTPLVMLIMSPATQVQGNGIMSPPTQVQGNGIMSPPRCRCRVMESYPSPVKVQGNGIMSPPAQVQGNVKCPSPAQVQGNGTMLLPA